MKGVSYLFNPFYSFDRVLSMHIPSRLSPCSFSTQDCPKILTVALLSSAATLVPIALILHAYDIRINDFIDMHKLFHSHVCCHKAKKIQAKMDKSLEKKPKQKQFPRNKQRTVSRPRAKIIPVAALIHSRASSKLGNTLAQNPPSSSLVYSKSYSRVPIAEYEQPILASPIHRSSKLGKNTSPYGDDLEASFLSTSKGMASEYSPSVDAKIGNNMSASTYFGSKAITGNLSAEPGASPNYLNKQNAEKCLKKLKDSKVLSPSASMYSFTAPDYDDGFLQYLDNDDICQIVNSDRSSSATNDLLPSYTITEANRHCPDDEESIITYSQLFALRSSALATQRNNSPSQLLEKCNYKRTDSSSRLSSQRSHLTLASAPPSHPRHAHVSPTAPSFSSYASSKKEFQNSGNLFQPVFRVQSRSSSKPSVKAQTQPHSFSQTSSQAQPPYPQQHDLSSSILSVHSSGRIDSTYFQAATFQTASCLITEYQPLNESTLSSSTFQSFHSSAN